MPGALTTEDAPRTTTDTLECNIISLLKDMDIMEHFESSRKTSYLKSKQHRLTSKKEALIIEQNLSTKCALTQ
jgi:hypothetical protein